MRKVMVFLAAALFVLPVVSYGADLTFGLLPRLEKKEMEAAFTPLVQYLEKELGTKVNLVIPADFDTWTKEAKAGAYDIAYTNPYLYVLLKKDVKAAEALVIASEPDIGTTIKGTFIVKSDSPIKSIKELKGTTVAFTDPGSAGAYLVQMLMLQNVGLQKSDVKVVFKKKRDPVADAVLSGEAAAGGIRDDDFEKLKAGAAKFRKLEVSEPIPNWVILVGKATDSARYEKIRAALLKLKPGDLKAIAIVAPAKIDGFVATTEKEFDVMREAAKAAGTY